MPRLPNEVSPAAVPAALLRTAPGSASLAVAPHRTPWRGDETALRVAFRLDATAALGLGHLKRCFALAQALAAQGARIAFAGRSAGLHDTVQATLGDVPWCEMSDPVAPAATAGAAPADREADAQADAGAFAAALPWCPQAVVVDHYGLDAGWHSAVRAAWPGLVLAAIDDLADRPLAVDLLVDHNPVPPGVADHAVKYAAVVQAPWPELLGGPRHALLDRVYARRAPRPVTDTVETLGLFLGGSDPAGHTLWLLNQLPAWRRASGWRGRVRVASTSANPRLDALRAACAAQGAELLLDLPDLCDFHAACDLQIGAGGGALWERCALGVPTLALITAPNQRASTPAAAAVGAVRAVEALQCSAGEAAAVQAAVVSLLNDAAARRALAAASLALVDGQGAVRVAQALRARVEARCRAGEQLRLRPAGVADAARLLAWRNDSATRAASLQPGQVDAAGHGAWLQRSLADPHRRLWIGLRGDQPVGTVRADWDRASGCTTLSWTVAPEARGGGIGARLVREAVAQIRGPLRAEVKPGNVASSRIALAAGLRPAPPRAEGEDWVEVYTRA